MCVGGRGGEGERERNKETKEGRMGERKKQVENGDGRVTRSMREERVRACVVLVSFGGP